MIVIDEVKSVPYEQIINFDLQYMVNESGLPISDAPPPLTPDELRVAMERGDQLFWILSSGQRAGYFWTEQNTNRLTLSSLVISTEFRNRGIGRQVMQWLDQNAQSRGIQKLTLAVSPLNINALKLYLSHGYQIVRCDENYFGTSSPGKFRLILEKDLLKVPAQDIQDETIEILSTDYAELMNATHINKFVGVSLQFSSEPQAKIVFHSPSNGPKSKTRDSLEKTFQ